FFFYNPTSPTKIYTLSLHDALPISMPTIEVDFDVFKALTARRLTEDVSENDVLREMLRLPKQPTRPVRSDVPAPDDWVTKGVRVDRKSTRLNSSHLVISYAVFCLKK